MFILTLPNTGDREGTCRINGKAARFRFLDHLRILSFRYEGSNDWQTRYIQDVRPAGNGLVTWVCTETPDNDTIVIG